MKVDNPRFGIPPYGLHCEDCPLMEVGDLCIKWNHKGCPTAETYTEACQLAEKTKEA